MLRIFYINLLKGIIKVESPAIDVSIKQKRSTFNMISKGLVFDNDFLRKTNEGVKISPSP